MDTIIALLVGIGVPAGFFMIGIVGCLILSNISIILMIPFFVLATAAPVLWVWKISLDII